MEAVNLYVSKRKYSLLLLVSLIFVAAGIFLFFQGREDEKILALLTILFFGAGALVFMLQMFNSKPRIILSDEGVFDRTLGVGLIPWSEITDVYIQSMRGNDFICLKLKDEDKWLRKLSKFKRLLSRGNKAIGFTSLSLNLSGVKASTEEVYITVLRKIDLHQD